MMRSSTETIIEALRILTDDLHSGDGVVSQCIREAADRLEELNAKRQPLSDDEIIRLGCNTGFAVDWDQSDDGIDEYGFLNSDGEVDNTDFIKYARAIERAYGIVAPSPDTCCDQQTVDNLRGVGGL